MTTGRVAFQSHQKGTFVDTSVGCERRAPDRADRSADVLGRTGGRPQQPGRCRPPARLPEDRCGRERDLGEGPPDGTGAAPRDRTVGRSQPGHLARWHAVAYSVPGARHATGYVVPTSGGTAREVCECVLQGWFADNRRILALDSPGMIRRVRAIDVVDRTEADLVTHPTFTSVGPTFRPDGRWLAFNSEQQIWIVPVRPGTPPEEREWVLILEKATTQTRRNERAGGRRMDACCICFSNATAFETSTHSESIGRAGCQSESHSSSSISTTLRRRWGSTPFGNAIVSNAFVFSQVEMTGSIWLLEPESGPRSRP